MRTALSVILFTAAFFGPAAPGNNDGQPGPLCGPILSLFGVYFNGPRRGSGSHVPAFRATPKKAIPTIRLMSVDNANGLDPAKLKHLPLYKQKMLDGTFDYAHVDNRISGQFHETTETFLLREGHHRILAALQIAAETGDWFPFKALIDHGEWTNVDSPGFSSVVRPIPVQPFEVPRARQKEMDKILSGMQIPTALRLYFNTQWMHRQ